jgi:hypothetical protein
VLSELVGAAAEDALVPDVRAERVRDGASVVLPEFEGPQMKTAPPRSAAGSIVNAGAAMSRPSRPV